MSHLSSLEEWFTDCPGAVIAFSGGVDSSLVAFLARHFLGEDRCLAVISASPSLKLSDLNEAKKFTQSHDIPLRIIHTREMDNPDYFNNPTNRCYFCKHTLYDELHDIMPDFPGWWVLNGTNVDDRGDYRPGLKAAEAFKVRSPLVDCDVDKDVVRTLAAKFNLECWNKPASPCLSSRVPYGEQITIKKLRQIEDAEAYLSRLGFSVNRVRHFGTLAKIEVPPEDVSTLLENVGRIRTAFNEIGFIEAEIDQEGFVSGKLNRAIGQAKI